MHFFQRKHLIPASLDETWLFFSSPHNLVKITPPYFHFKITSDTGNDPIYAGMIITYKLNPLPGIPWEWVTEITQARSPHFFVDEQRSGPYTIWHHEHHFREVNGMTEMTDTISYKLPGGPIGKLFNHIFVRHRLQNIFDYREQQITKIFG